MTLNNVQEAVLLASTGNQEDEAGGHSVHNGQY